MKAFNSTIVIIFSLFIFLKSQAQSTISIELGIDSPTYTLKSEEDSTIDGQKLEQFKESYYAGVALELDPFVASNNWFLRLGILYSIDVQDWFAPDITNNDSEEIFPQSIIVPFGLKYWTSFPSGKSGLFIEAGGIARYDITNYKNGANLSFFEQGLSMREINLAEDDFNKLSFGAKAALGIWFWKFELAASVTQNFAYTNQDRTNFNIDRFYVGGSLRYTIPLIKK